MARELGLNPKKIGSLANHRQEPWKEPLPQFIATMYERRFGRRRPERVVSIEKRVAELAEKKAQRRARRADQRRADSLQGTPCASATPATQTTVARVQASHMDVTRESATIVTCAAAHESRIISIGPLLFFSTETGDAWVLDPGDGLARCLARDGAAEPNGITETAERVAVEWEGTYFLSGEMFTVVDRAGRASAFAGYPVKQIRSVISLMAAG